MAESKLIVVGVNHKSTPVELRERLAFTHGKIEDSTERLGEFPEILESLIISTCNRVEIYARGENVDNGIHLLKQFICEYHGINIEELDKHFYSYREEKTVEHLFRVSSSLDSMVVGEAQILGQ